MFESLELLDSAARPVRAGLLSLTVALLIGAGPASAPANAESKAGPSFRLVDQNGRAVDERSFAAKPTVLQFGFTSCPVVCPTTMFGIAERMRELGALADDIQFIFVTVDPDRDTPEQLKQYLASFDDRIIGLSGPESEIKALADGLGATVSRQALESGGYTFDHTIFAYLLASGWTKEGVLYMGSTARSERVLARLRAVVAKAADRSREARTN